MAIGVAVSLVISVTDVVSLSLVLIVLLFVRFTNIGGEDMTNERRGREEILTGKITTFARH